MSVFVSICGVCKIKLGVPRPGSVVGVKEIMTECYVCGTQVSSDKGYDVPEPKKETEAGDLLSMD